MSASTGPALRIQLLESLDALAPHAEAWHALLETAMPGRGFFYRLPMLQAMAPVHAAPDHPGGRRSPFFLLAWRGEQLVGGLPLVLERKPLSRAGVRRLLLWGGDGGALGLEGEIPLLGDDGTRVETVHAFLRELRGPLRHRFDRLALGLLRSDGASLGPLRAALPEARWTRNAMRSHVADLRAGRAAYVSSRSGGRLREIRRLGRRFAEAHALRWEEPTRLSPEQQQRVVALHMARQRDLTSRGWRRDTVFEKDHYRDALLTLLERAADAGRTRHLLLLADEQIVGFLLGFREGGTVLAFLTAVDDRFLAFGPGGVLFWEYMERALSAGDIQRIEFGVGTTFVKDTVSNAGEAPVEASWDPPAPPLGRLRRRAYDGLTALRAARQSR